MENKIILALIAGIFFLIYIWDSSSIIEKIKFIIYNNLLLVMMVAIISVIIWRKR